MDVDLPAVTGQHVGQNLGARLTRLLQHDRAPIEQEVGEAGGRARVDVYRGDPVRPTTGVELCRKGGAREKTNLSW